MKATVQQRAGLEAFADPKSRPDQLAAGGLAAHEDKYDFKSENVIELLKQLELKFEDDKLAGTKAETNAINAYDLTKEASDNDAPLTAALGPEPTSPTAALTRRPRMTWKPTQLL